MTTKRALISVFDKAKVVELARGLHELDFELVSTGTTASTIRDAGIPATAVSDMTGFPEIMGGRVKTLHPKVHGGILAMPDDEKHQAQMAEHGIEPFDLVVVNLYPFVDTVASGVSPLECIEMIDIGGPTMVRAAAKNHAYVGVVTDPADYVRVLEELQQNGTLSAETRRSLARKAFAHTAAYDAAIVSWFDDQDRELLPETLHASYTKAPLTLRYGENPHQRAAIYADDGADPWWSHTEQYSGLDLSYLNMYDTDAAWRLVHEPALGEEPMCAIIKHANPSGFAIATTLAEAYRRAFACDEMSAFGGIVAFNRVIDNETVEAMVAAAQADVIIAPGYATGVIDRLTGKRRNTRLLEAPAPVADVRHLRPITGGLLVQEPHRFAALLDSWTVVTERHPTSAELADAWVAFVLGGYVKSNSIVDVKDRTAWGIGAGQQNRLESARIATEKAARRAQGGACGSDAFFPFEDGIEAAAAGGVAIIVQPGGAQHDHDNIVRANELGLAMVFTGERHFIH